MNILADEHATTFTGSLSRRVTALFYARADRQGTSIAYRRTTFLPGFCVIKVSTRLGFCRIALARIITGVTILVKIESAFFCTFKIVQDIIIIFVNEIFYFEIRCLAIIGRIIRTSDASKRLIIACRIRRTCHIGTGLSSHITGGSAKTGFFINNRTVATNHKIFLSADELTSNILTFFARQNLGLRDACCFFRITDFAIVACHGIVPAAVLFACLR